MAVPRMTFPLDWNVPTNGFSSPIEVDGPGAMLDVGDGSRVSGVDISADVFLGRGLR